MFLTETMMKITRPQTTRPVVPPPAAVQTPKVVAKAIPKATPSASSEVEAKSRAAVEKYFAAFEAHDTKTLQAIYAPDASFKDNMFDLPNHDSIMNMWSKAPPFKKFEVQVLGVQGNEVHTRWTADYEIFGHQVHNEIDSRITVNANGQLETQREHWDQSKWLSQALPVIPKWAQGLAMGVLRPILNWKTRAD